MKRTGLVWAVALTIGCIGVSAKDFKVVDVRSGKIDYEIRGSGNMMGMRTETIGKKRMIFDRYGVRTLTEVNKIEKQTMGGHTETTRSHTIVYMNGEEMKTVDFSTKTITVKKNPAYTMMKSMKEADSAVPLGLAMLQKMGGKKIGTDNVLGYPCDVWEIMGSKQCVYKGVALRVETDVMGIKQTEMATKAAFDIDIDESSFKLPDFPVNDMSGATGGLNGMSGEEMAAMVKAMGDVVEKSGVDIGKGQMSTENVQRVQGAVIAAMMPQMKEQMAKEADAISVAKACFAEADDVKDAVKCSRKLDEMLGEESAQEPVGEWNEAIKKETLAEMEKALKNLKCAKNAQNPAEIEACMSR